MQRRFHSHLTRSVTPNLSGDMYGERNPNLSGASSAEYPSRARVNISSFLPKIVAASKRFVYEYWP